MSTQQFPYTVFALTPGFRVKPVTIVEEYRSFVISNRRLKDESGKVYSAMDLYSTVEAALAAGYKLIAIQSADLQKRKERIDKRLAELDRQSAKRG